MDLSKALETLRKENTERNASETVESRTGQILEGYWQRIAQDRQMWNQHAETFAQPWDTMAAQ